MGSSNNGDSSGGWEIVYSGFVLILLCFFIMLSSFASMEQAKVMRFVKSFSDAVSILPGGLKFESGLSMLDPSMDIVEKEKEVAAVFKEVEKLINTENLSNNVNLTYSEKGLVLTLADTVLFNVGIANISPKAIPLLTKVGSIISKTSCNVRIEGHTDNLPIHTRRFPSNWELSTIRAVNVLRYFVEKHQIPAGKLSAAGLGEFHPVLPNDRPDHRSKNRRVEIIFLDNEQAEDI
jgi:chemotaxis protein MotB